MKVKRFSERDCLSESCFMPKPRPRWSGVFELSRIAETGFGDFGKRVATARKGALKKNIKFNILLRNNECFYAFIN